MAGCAERGVEGAQSRFRLRSRARQECRISGETKAPVSYRLHRRMPALQPLQSKRVRIRR